MAQWAGGGRWGRNVKGKEALAGVQGGAVSKQRLEDQETQEGRRGVEGPSQVRWEARSDAESIEEAPAGSKVLLGNAVTSGSGWRTGVRGNHPGGWGAGAQVCEGSPVLKWWRVDQVQESALRSPGAFRSLSPAAGGRLS